MAIPREETEVHVSVEYEGIGVDLCVVFALNTCLQFLN